MIREETLRHLLALVDRERELRRAQLDRARESGVSAERLLQSDARLDVMHRELDAALRWAP